MIFELKPWLNYFLVMWWTDANFYHNIVVRMAHGYFFKLVCLPHLGLFIEDPSQKFGQQHNNLLSDHLHSWKSSGATNDIEGGHLE